ncbi:MAG: type II secretion system protein [Candidatus Omnitrophota bacterium]
MNMKKQGFTYIELLVTLAIIAVLFVPIMQLFSHSVYSASVSQDLVTAANLAKWQMERIKNLNYTKKKLKEMGNDIYPPMDQSPLEINGVKWRIKRVLIVKTEEEVAEEEDGLTEPLELRVEVYREGEDDAPLVTLVTLIEDMFWAEIEAI